MKIRFLILALIAIVPLLGANAAQAQATRTWVSGVGDDVNPCSRTAPCKTFAGAISKTATFGEISVLDPGGFGAVTIGKSIALITGGPEAGITAAGTTGIIINAAGAIVTLNGIVLEGAGTGITGIRILAAAQVHIRNVVIKGFKSSSATSNAITIDPSATATKVFIHNTVLINNTRGILVSPTGAGTAEVVLEAVSIQQSGPALTANGAGADVWVSNSLITQNTTGLTLTAGGIINSFGNNVLINNTTDGAFTAPTILPK